MFGGVKIGFFPSRCKSLFYLFWGNATSIPLLRRSLYRGKSHPRHVSSTCFLIPTPSSDSLYNRNSTSTLFSSPVDTYWGQFDEISKYNLHLNVWERLWSAWYAYLQNDVLATGIMSFAMHEIVYFGRSIPWAIIDRISYLNKYKIQNVWDRCCTFTSGIVRLTSWLAKNSHSTRTMELRQAGPAISFYC